MPSSPPKALVFTPVADILTVEFAAKRSSSTSVAAYRLLIMLRSQQLD
jgi:hypothetical protein